uniref:Uncharacterized protein n=1 Tax=Oryza glaberrima TaxID=4538 RepID=I1NP07_ORYGL
MGKYMRKAKVVVSGEVVAAAVMELAAAPLGVRTRARSLALQKRQGGEYLELRSRRLEKLPPPPPPPPRRRATAAAATADATAAESAEAEVSFGGENVLELEAMERSSPVWRIKRPASPVACLIRRWRRSTPPAPLRTGGRRFTRTSQPVAPRNPTPPAAAAGCAGASTPASGTGTK